MKKFSIFLDICYDFCTFIFPILFFLKFQEFSLNFPINVESGLQVVLRSFLREYVICTLSRCCHLVIFLVVWLFYVPSTGRSFRDGTPHLLSLVKDVKLGFYTVPTGNRTPGRRMAVHYTTTAPHQLLKIQSRNLAT